MKLKSLLLASGAAVVAVSGARAADAVIIPEPEPVEYVRVCDAAGTGYFYIPGTETCLQISGEVIYKINFRNTPDDDDGGNFDNEQNGWEKEYEISLDFNTWRDTEYGALTTSIQLGASDDTIGSPTQDELGDAGVSVNEAFITLGGLTIGYTDSFYPGGLGASDLDAEGPDTGLIGYTVDFGSGSFGIALEDDGNVDWIPAIAAVAVAEFGDFTVAAAGVYDDTDEFFGAQLHLIYSSGPLTVDASAQYSSDSDGFETSAYSADYEWVLALGADYAVTSQLTVFAGVDYGIDQFFSGGNDDFLVEVGADYELVDGFTIGVQADFSDRNTGDFDFEDAEITFTRSF
ncbi:MAG: porin [Pseudomonadota bacterium]